MNPETPRPSTSPPAEGDAQAAPPASAQEPGIRLKQILVPVDFSVCSRKALEYAGAFATQFGSRLILAHVLELSYVGSGLGEIEAPSLESEVRQNAAQRIAQLAKELPFSSVPYTEVVVVGRPWREVTELARKMGVDLIIMGTHGYTGLKHVMMGSTAERVIRHAPCPVLVVREVKEEPAPGQGSAA